MQYRGLVLDRFQREAAEAIERGRSVIVSAPTGTGKTLIADYLIDQILADGGEVVYTSPVKALSNQKYRQYVELFGAEKVGLVTGDLVIRRDAPLRIMTTEILRNILLEGRLDPVEEDDEARPAGDPFGRLRAVIVDEIHFLDDPDRGTVWEELLIYLPRTIQVLGLSATLSNLDEFTDWLGEVRGAPFEVVYEPKRTVPLAYHMMSKETGLLPVAKFNAGFARWRAGRGRGAARGDRGRERGRGGRRGAKGRGRGGREQGTRHHDVIDALGESSFPALYFIFSRALVERLAGDLARGPSGARFADDALRRAVGKKLDAFEREFPDVLTEKLRAMYRRGIAFHHAGLHVALKGLVEQMYEAGLVRVLYCTSTFALGINLPARTVIFDSLTKYDGESVKPLRVREFMQMAGRAGRRGIDVEGDVVVRQDYGDYGEVEKLVAKLLEGESEPVTSAFNLSFHSVVNLLERFDEDAIRALIGRSFRAWRSREAAAELRCEIERRGDAPEREARSPKEERRIAKRRRQMSSLRRQLVEEERPYLWEEFRKKLEFLRSYGYIGPDNELYDAARVLKHIKVAEIFVTEMIVDGALEGREPAELFGIMCGLVQTLPRTRARAQRPDQVERHRAPDRPDLRLADRQWRGRIERQRGRLHPRAHAPGRALGRGRLARRADERDRVPDRSLRRLGRRAAPRQGSHLAAALGLRR